MGKNSAGPLGRRNYCSCFISRNSFCISYRFHMSKKERKSVKKQLQNIQARRKNVRKMPQKIPAKSRKGKGKKR